MKMIVIGLFALLGVVTTVVMPSAVYAQDASVQVKTVSGPTATEVAKQRLHNSWPWYIIRASGIIAGVTLVILLLSGIGQITGHTYKFLPPLTAWASHRSLGIVFGISIIVHMLGLFFDHFAPFSIPELLIPWMSAYKPVTIGGINVGSLWVAFGVLGFWLSMIVVVSSLKWVEKKPKPWKRIHFLSYLIIVLVFLHSLFLGSDFGTGWWRVAWIASGIAILIASAARGWRLWTT